MVPSREPECPPVLSRCQLHMPSSGTRAHEQREAATRRLIIDEEKTLGARVTLIPPRPALGHAAQRGRYEMPEDDTFRTLEVLGPLGCVRCSAGRDAPGWAAGRAALSTDLRLP